MDREHAQSEGSPPRGGGPASAAEGSADPGARDEGGWRRVLLLVWGASMTAVVIAGIIGFLVYFFQLSR